MNKVTLMGRLTRDCDVRYSQSAEPLAIVRFSIAVNRRFKREGEPDADFFNCVSFGKQGETINRYFKKGNQILIIGSLRNNNWTDKEGQKRYSIEINVEEFYFCESKAAAEASRGSYTPPVSNAEPAQDTQVQAPVSSESFYDVDQSVDEDDLPF